MESIIDGTIDGQRQFFAVHSREVFLECVIVEFTLKPLCKFVE